MPSFDILSIGEITKDTICTTDRFVDNGTQLNRIYTGFGGRASNVAAYARVFGKTALLVSTVGNDFGALGGFAYMKEKGLSTCGLSISKKSPTSVVIIVSNRNHLKCYFSEGPTRLASELASYRNKIKTTLRSQRYRLVLATGSGFSSPAVSLAALENAKEGSIRAFLPGQETDYYDAKRLAACLRSTDLLFLNQHETKVVAKRVGSGSIASVIKRFGIKVAVLTRGAEGSTVYSSGTVSKIGACRPRRVIDATGAGDSYAGAFIASYLDTNDPVYSARIASSTASFTIEEIGVQSIVPAKKDILARARQTYGSALRAGKH